MLSKEIDLSPIEISSSFFAINQEVYDLYKKATDQRLPCGYAWTTIKLTDNGWELQDMTPDGRVGTKEGQARFGDIKSRIKSFETKHPQLLLDVLIDPHFETPHADKKLNEWRDEHEDGVQIDHSVRSIESMEYENLDAFEELRMRRRSALSMLTEDPLVGAIDLYLGTVQWNKAVDALELHQTGCRSILADKCPRFGKTTWSSVVADMTDVDIVVVTAYVKTVFTSFRTDLSNKKQFLQKYVHINTEEPNWKEKLSEALSKDMKAICYVSLCQGNNRQDRIDYIGSLNKSRYWIVDEADYGAHQKKQVDALKQGIKDQDYLMLMTGTSPDIAVRQWVNVRKFEELTTTYTELLLQKNATKKEMFA